MCAYETVAAVTALAIAIAEKCETDELGVLATIFTQLGDTLATIALQRELCEEKGADIQKQNSNMNKDADKLVK